MRRELSDELWSQAAVSLNQEPITSRSRAQKQPPRKKTDRIEIQTKGSQNVPGKVKAFDTCFHHGQSSDDLLLRDDLPDLFRDAEAEVSHQQPARVPMARKDQNQQIFGKSTIPRDKAVLGPNDNYIRNAEGQWVNIGLRSQDEMQKKVTKIPDLTANRTVGQPSMLEEGHNRQTILHPTERDPQLGMESKRGQKQSAASGHPAKLDISHTQKVNQVSIPDSLGQDSISRATSISVDASIIQHKTGPLHDVDPSHRQPQDNALFSQVVGVKRSRTATEEANEQMGKAVGQAQDNITVRRNTKRQRTESPEKGRRITIGTRSVSAARAATRALHNILRTTHPTPPLPEKAISKGTQPRVNEVTKENSNIINRKSSLNESMNNISTLARPFPKERIGKRLRTIEEEEETDREAPSPKKVKKGAEGICNSTSDQENLMPPPTTPVRRGKPRAIRSPAKPKSNQSDPKVHTAPAPFAPLSPPLKARSSLTRLDGLDSLFSENGSDNSSKPESPTNHKASKSVPETKDLDRKFKARESADETQSLDPSDLDTPIDPKNKHFSKEDANQILD